MHIIVEGPTGSGKSTFIRELTKFTPWLHFDAFHNNPASLAEVGNVTNEFERQLQHRHSIHDRFDLSERLYSQLLQRPSTCSPEVMRRIKQDAGAYTVLLLPNIETTLERWHLRLSTTEGSKHYFNKSSDEDVLVRAYAEFSKAHADQAIFTPLDYGTPNDLPWATYQAFKQILVGAARKAGEVR